MKINFNRRTSIILNKYCNKSPNWFNDLIFEFHNHYDLDSDDSEVIGFMSSQTGTKTFVDWLKIPDMMPNIGNFNIITKNVLHQ